MILSTSQLRTIKTWILANAASLGDPETAGTLNALATPSFWVWRTSVTKDEIVGQTSQDGTNFAWTANGFITRSAGEQAAFREIFAADGTCNPSRANVRQAFQDIFSGTGNAAANRTHLLASARRQATVAEKLLSTGTGSTGSPAMMGPEDEFTVQNGIDARNS